MTKKQVPRRLWDYGLVWTCETGNLCTSSSRYANKRTAIEIITGETPDISEYIDFGLYDWISYRANAGLGETSIGRWLGVSHKVGQLMSYWILTQNGRVISCTTVQRLTNLEKQTDEWKERMRLDNNAIEQNIVQVNNDEININDVPRWNHLSLHEEDEAFRNEFQRIINDDSIKDADLLLEDESGQYTNMEIGLPRGEDGQLERAVVKKRVIDVDGKPFGKSHSNPLVDSSLYEIEYLDGTIEVMPANLMAENILLQVDEEGRRQQMLDEIIDHKTTHEAVKKEDGYIVNHKKGTKRKKMTTVGWELCVQWKDGSSN